MSTGPARPRATKRLEPRVVLLWTRRLVLAGSLAGLAYAWGRFDSFALDLPCSPLVRLSPGTRLWIDRKPPRYHAGDLAFFLGPEGSVHIGEVRELDGEGAEGRLWLETDEPGCPGLDSRALGWIPRERMQGRVVFASSHW